MTLKGRLGAIIGAMAGGPSQGELLRLRTKPGISKQYQEAAELYDRALRSAAPNVDVLLLLQCGHMHKDAGNLSEAEARYLRALGVEPKNPEVLLQLGHFYKVAGRYADAKRYYQEALIARPGLTDAEDELHRLGTSAELQFEKGPLEVRNPAGGLPQKEPDEHDRRLQRELLRLADDARDRKQYLVAAELYDRALRAAEPNVDALLLLQCGHMHKEARSFTEAKARYLKALSLEPKNAEVLIQLGHFFKVIGRYPDAEHYYQEALIARPEWADPEDELHRLRTSVELQLEKARLERLDRVGRLAQEELDEFDGRIDPDLFPKTRDELYISHQDAFVFKRNGIHQRTQWGVGETVRGWIRCVDISCPRCHICISKSSSTDSLSTRTTLSSRLSGAKNPIRISRNTSTTPGLISRISGWGSTNWCSGRSMCAATPARGSTGAASGSS